MVTIADLRKKWEENSEAYKTREVGSGVHSFITNVFACTELFNLKETPSRTGRLNTFVHDTESGKEGRPDFVLYTNKDFHIPVEAKCHTRIKEGVTQLQRYQLDTAKQYQKQYGILTDGFEWRFYRASSFKKVLLPEMLDNPKDFITYWNAYIKPENYYIEAFNPSGQQSLFDERIDLNVPANRPIFFDDITQVIGNFKAKMEAIGTWDLFNHNDKDKISVETSYAYLIQFILYKVLVDNDYSKFKEEYDSMFCGIRQAIQNENLYRLVTNDMRNISEYISKHIYKPFAKEQEYINKKLIEKLTAKPTLDEIAPWLDILIFINKYDFANLKNEIFGFIYENYLKDLYGEENKGQYFTDPAVVNFMLDHLGYTEKKLGNDSSNISIIDPSCGAGTFLYSAVDRIIKAYSKNDSKSQAEFIESIVDKNIFGLDTEEFPLFLAEMSILMRLLPLIINDNYENPIDNKLKIFKTKDSISEFLDTGISSNTDKGDLFSHLKETALDYPSFMRDEKDLQEMLKSLRLNMGKRLRFDYVIGNPPYVGYLETNRQGVEFTKKIKARSQSISLGNVYGVNLHSTPDNKKKYPPMPNLYAFFVALGIALLKDGGKLCYIIPQTLLTAGDLDVLRYYLARNITIEKIVTFGGNLFIGRGLKQKKIIATSSLIIVAGKQSPSVKHNINIINYDTYTNIHGVDFETYFQGRNKNSKTIAQSELASRIMNWNFIKWSTLEEEMVRQYNASTENACIYYEHKISKSVFNETFWFDRGLKYNKKEINSDEKEWALIMKQKHCINIGLSGNHIATKHLILPHGSQGLCLFEKKYKILWSYMNFDKFYFSDKRIMVDYNWIVISSDSKPEMLFLLAVLNSRLSFRLLDLYLRNENEQAMLLGIKSIKQYIRFPKITAKNNSIKAEIIKCMEEMLDLEKVRLHDIVEFGALSVQKFDLASVKGSSLALSRKDKEYKCKIARGKSSLVAKVASESFGGLAPVDEITLSALKSTPAIDVDQQTDVKDYIDDLVFALYFNVPVPEININSAHKIRNACAKNKYYRIIKEQTQR